MAGGGARGGSDRAAGAAHSPTTTTAIQSTIQSIKEVVGGHSDADILYTLRESNMDPNETAQKLLNQGSPSLCPVTPIWAASIDLVPHRELGFSWRAPSRIGSALLLQSWYRGCVGLRCTV
jgi:hypothetical protein